jgi:SAM-dependent MidA family methyltransferase
VSPADAIGQDGADRALSLPSGIARAMAAEGGRVTFARFMGLALTHPTDGYYARTGRLLGRRGHFSTAPYLSPAFGRALGRLITELLDASLALASSAEVASVVVPAAAGRPGAGAAAAGPSRTDALAGPPLAVVELGGGEGDLARAVLRRWDETRPDLKERVVYCIVEISEGLRACQAEATSEWAARGWRVRWAGDLAAAATGARPVVIVGNEFVDVLPVHLVDVRGPRPREAWVEVDPDGSRVSEVWSDLSPEAEVELHLLFADGDLGRLPDLSRDGIVELRPAVGSLLRDVAIVMPEGCLVTVDYGGWLPGVEVGNGCGCGLAGEPSRGRTVRGYFRHQTVHDPYARIGRQDLTADVDFRALDLHGREAGAETVLYTTVAALLRADGGEEEWRMLRAQAGGSLDADREAAVLEALLDEESLGGSFKVMLQVWG